MLVLKVKKVYGWQSLLNLNICQEACDKNPYCMIWEVCNLCDVCYLKRFELQASKDWCFGIKNCNGDPSG